MSASQRILQREDLAQILLALKDIDPAKIAAAEEEKRKQVSLTADETSRVIQARSYLAKYDAIVAEIKKREDSLSTQKDEHDANVSRFNQDVASKNKELSDREASLNLIADKQSEVQNSQNNREKELNKRSADIEAERVKWVDDLTKKTSEVAQMEVDNERIRKELAAWEQKLKDKAARLLAEVQS